MEIPSENPNQVTPATLARVIRVAHSILEELGVESPKTSDGRLGAMPDVESATLPIESSALTRVPEGGMSSVRISRPTGDFAKSSRWAYTIHYGMQHASHSRQVIVMDSGELPEAEMSFYDSHSTRALTEPEAQAIVSDLSRVAGIEV